MNNTEQTDNIELKHGYLVGVTEEGVLVFRPVGGNVGLIELLGLHKYAEKRIQIVLDHSQGTGDMLTAKILQLLEKELVVEGDQKVGG